MMRVLTRFLFVAVVAGLLGTLSTANAQENPGSENFLPANTRAWFSVPDAQALKKALEGTQFGAMMDDPNVKPFADDLVKQLRGYLNEQNIRFGMKLEDIEGVQSGEVCIAGMLRETIAGDGSKEVTGHAIALLVDVEGSEDEAKELLSDVGDELAKREATKTEFEIGGIKAVEWAFKAPEGMVQRQYAYHAMVGKWMVACDNKAAFKGILSQIAETKEGPGTLAANPAFKKTVEICQFEGKDYDTHFRWFVEPFGYVQLAQAIADAKKAGEGIRNDYAGKLEEEGFSAIKGVGGVLTIGSDSYEAAHRTLIYAPPTVEGDDRYEKAAAMLDFRNKEETPLFPPVWVPENAAGYLTFTWDIEKALTKVGYIADKISGKPGTFDRAIKNLAEDPQGPRFDLRQVLARLNHRITVCSVTQLPITEESERMVFGIKITHDESYVADSFKRLHEGTATVEEYKGVSIMVVDTADDGEMPEIEIDEGDFGGEFGGEFGGDEESDEGDSEEDEFKKPKPLFEQQVFAVHNGYLFIGNNADQIKSIIDSIESKPGDKLAEAEDYVRVNKALVKLAGDEPPSFRHFGRLDMAIRTNYEMLRTGRMAESKTLLAQLLNRAYTTEDAPEDFVREQQIDGSKMPEDFEGQVAKYFGPAGLVIHTTDDGWVVTGCVLKKDTTQATAKEEKKASTAEKTDPTEKKKEEELASEKKEELIR